MRKRSLLFLLLLTSLLCASLRVFMEQPVFRAELPPTISESSGLIFIDGQLWTHNDRGGEPCIYRIDTADASIRQTVTLKNCINHDWEDITADKDHIYIGDFGNNDGSRTDLRILVINRSDINKEPVCKVPAQVIQFSYADQHKFIPSSKNNYDCEAMVSMGDSLFLFSKDRGDGHSRVYGLPKKEGKYKIFPSAEFNADGRICGAAYNALTKQLMLVGYKIAASDAFLWRIDNIKGSHFFSGTMQRIEIGENRPRWKTEGITYLDNKRLFISCERTEKVKAGLYIFKP